LTPKTFHLYPVSRSNGCIKSRMAGLQHGPDHLVRNLCTYQVYIADEPATALSGHIASALVRVITRQKKKREHLRAQEERYALSTQYDHSTPSDSLNMARIRRGSASS
jgi:hypothetical protein